MRLVKKFWVFAWEKEHTDGSLGLGFEGIFFPTCVIWCRNFSASI